MRHDVETLVYCAGCMAVKFTVILLYQLLYRMLNLKAYVPYVRRCATHWSSPPEMRRVALLLG